MHVRPCPQLRALGRTLASGEGDERQRPIRDVLAFGVLALLQNDERDPWAELQARGGRRRIAPREILVVKIDGRKIVGLEVGNARSRFGADDGAWVDAEDIVRARRARCPERRIA